MVVAHNDINAVFVGHLHLVVGFDTTVKGDQQVHIVVAAIFHALVGDAIALRIAVGNIVFHQIFGIGTDNLAKERVKKRHGGGSINIIIAVNQNFLVVDNSVGQAFHGLVHILHQEGVMEFADVGVEELFSRLRRINASLDKQCGQRFLNGKLGGQFLCSRIIW